MTTSLQEVLSVRPHTTLTTPSTHTFSSITLRDENDRKLPFLFIKWLFIVSFTIRLRFKYKTKLILILLILSMR